MKLKNKKMKSLKLIKRKRLKKEYEEGIFLKKETLGIITGRLLEKKKLFLC